MWKAHNGIQTISVEQVQKITMVVLSSNCFYLFFRPINISLPMKKIIQLPLKSAIELKFSFNQISSCNLISKNSG